MTMNSVRHLILCNVRKEEQIFRHMSTKRPLIEWAPTRRDVLTACVGAVCTAAGLLWMKNYLYSSRGERLSNRTLKQYRAEIVKDSDFGRSMTKVLTNDKKVFFLPDFISTRDLGYIEKFKVNDGDIFVASFPKSGTTWIQEIVYLLQNDMDFESARNIKLDDRFAYLEYICPGLKTLSNMPSPRLIKTHLPYQFLPDDLKNNNGKLIYITRNPRDVSVSYFHFLKNFQDTKYKKTFDNFFEKFKRGVIFYGPWWNHAKSYFVQKTKINVLFISYEELQQDPKKEIRKIAAFLNKNITDSEIDDIATFCSFSQMKFRRNSNYSWLKDMGLLDQDKEFIRNGIVGDWENYFTVKMVTELDEILMKELQHERTFIYNL